jgi:exodeoxyribonuclease-3
MRVLTWNVNSIRSRMGRLAGVLERHGPDVACLQELKCTDEQFPYEAVKAVGYHAVVFGQKTYNGVAILARTEPRDVRLGLEEAASEEARCISADIEGVRVICAYVPNGQTIGSEKFAYKLDWLANLRALLERDFDSARPLVLCGDTNVVLDDADAARPDAWAGTVLAVPQVRHALGRVIDWGLVDVLREKHPAGGVYSWWDYRQLGFPRNDGLRLDHILATTPLAARCASAEVDRDERKAASDPDGEKPSDHAPVIADFDFPA